MLIFDIAFLDLLFKKIVTINFEDFVLGPELQEGACPFSQFQEVCINVCFLCGDDEKCPSNTRLRIKLVLIISST